jgi:hypothetical protein
VVTSSNAIIKGSGSEGARGDEKVPGAVSAPLQDPLAEAEVSNGPEAGVLDITLLRCLGVVDHGNLCGLLTGCLLLTLGCFLIGYFFNKSC